MEERESERTIIRQDLGPRAAAAAAPARRIGQSVSRQRAPLLNTIAITISIISFGDGGGEMFFLYYYSDVDNLMATLLLSDGRRR